MGAREHFVAEWLLAAVAIVLTAAVVIGSMFSHTNSPQAPPDTAPSTAAPKHHSCPAIDGAFRADEEPCADGSGRL